MPSSDGPTSALWSMSILIGSFHTNVGSFHQFPLTLFCAGVPSDEVVAVRFFNKFEQSTLVARLKTAQGVVDPGAIGASETDNEDFAIAQYEVRPTRRESLFGRCLMRHCVRLTCRFGKTCAHWRSGSSCCFRAQSR